MSSIKPISSFLEMITKMEPLENELISAHLVDLLNLEKDAVEKLLVRYEEVSKELRKLITVNTDYTFTVQHYNQTLAQVEAGIIQMKTVLMKELSDNELNARLQSLGHLVKEITFYEPMYEGSLQLINLSVTSKMDDIKNFRMLGYQTTIDKYGLDLIGRVQDILVKGIISQKFHNDLKNEIMEELDSKLWKASEIVRTELNNAYNEAHLVGLQSAVQDLPGLKKQWVATLDGRTGQDSIALNGQIREVDKPFDYFGKPIDRPPTRPNCRCRIIAYKEDWEKVGDTDDASDMSNS